MTIGFLGLGNMAGAVLRGMIKSGQFKGDRLLGYDRHPEKCQAMQQECGLEVASGVEELTHDSQVLLLCIKPKGLPDLLSGVGPLLQADQTVISLAAGKPLRFYEQYLTHKPQLLRAIPNINARVGQSQTALCASENALEESRQIALKIFSAIGAAVFLEEALLPAYTALSGAGPAFACLFIDALTSAGIKAGLSRPMAQQAACRMLAGSAELVLQSGEHPRALVDQVTSPGGTTIEGVHALSEHGFEHAVQQAIQAVIDKDQRL